MFKARLVYKESSRIARATQRNKPWARGGGSEGNTTNQHSSPENRMYDSFRGQENKERAGALGLQAHGMLLGRELKAVPDQAL